MSLVPSLRAVSYIVAVLAGVFVGFMACALLVTWPLLRPARIYRFPVPDETRLTESNAIEISKKALMADGLSSAMMHPIPYTDEVGYFYVNPADSDKGCMYWLTASGRYGVNLERKGAQIVCRVYMLK